MPRRMVQELRQEASDRPSEAADRERGYSQGRGMMTDAPCSSLGPRVCSRVLGLFASDPLILVDGSAFTVLSKPSPSKRPSVTGVL